MKQLLTVDTGCSFNQFQVLVREVYRKGIDFCIVYFRIHFPHPHPARIQKAESTRQELSGHEVKLNMYLVFYIEPFAVHLF
jgi:hypothetical protein